MDDSPRRWARVGAAGALLLAVACCGAPARAQDTGGSFGGGDFGGGGDVGGGSDVGGSSDFGSSSSDFGSSTDGSGAGSARSASGSDACMFGGFVLLILVAVVISSVRQWRKNAPGAPLEAARRPDDRDIDVSALMVALDARARPFVQKRLDELARAGDARSTGGLHRLLHETISVLRRSELAWTYLGVVSTKPLPRDEAEALFRRTAGDLRSRFRHELVRQDQGAITTAEAPAVRAREHEGEGLVVVSVVVAARTELPDVTTASDRAQTDALVRSIGAMPEPDLVALEVVWSPAAEDDRMSSAELEALYPEMKLVRGADAFGRAFCRYCSGPFARELPRCPHCGAPSSESERA